MSDGSPSPLALGAAYARADELARGGERRMLGIAGPPGCGKSTIARAIAERVGDRACLVGMDGFHLAQGVLEGLGRADRKGALDTFDVAGYVALLQRLRARPPEPVYAPVFDRELEQPIAAAVELPSSASLVITEGNYVLARVGGWGAVRGLLDEVWYVDTPAAIRIPWLIERHVRHGRSPEAARAWVMRSDERNAELVRATRALADRSVQYPSED
jgi:pantothenate kinase